LTDMTAEEVGQHLGRAPSTVRNLCAAGEFPGAYKLNGKDWRIPREALRQYVVRQRDGETDHLRPATVAEYSAGRSRRRRRRRQLVALG
jgi:excisionase family DNA binding protein